MVLQKVTFFSIVDVRMSFVFVALDFLFGNVEHFKNGFSMKMSVTASPEFFILSPTMIEDDEEGGGKSGKTGCELDS